MNTFEINAHLKTEKCFLGTYPSDKLPIGRIKKRPLAMVINLDPASLPGSHWVGLFINENNIANYFDSFGRCNVSDHILEFLRLNNIKYLQHNTTSIQDKSSMTCGVYCILFIRMLCSSFTFEDFMRIFTKNTKNNDVLVVKSLI